MLSWSKRKPDVNPTLASLQFDARGWKDHGEQQPNHMRVWQTPDGDGVGLYFFNLAPNIPPCKTIGELSEFYQRISGGAGAELVECALEPIAGQTSIRVLMKAPQKPHGRLYQASYTIPFRDQLRGEGSMSRAWYNGSARVHVSGKAHGCR
jgi:hypothetical protein